MDDEIGGQGCASGAMALNVAPCYLLECQGAKYQHQSYRIVGNFRGRIIFADFADRCPQAPSPHWK